MNLLEVNWTPLIQHVGLFAVLVVAVSVVYNGLRREDVGEIVRIGLARATFFIVASLAVFGGGFLLLAQWL
jgi:hypothetical protein